MHGCLAPSSLSGRARRLACGRRRTPTAGGHCRDGSAVAVCDLLDDRQTESGAWHRAGFGRAVKPVEHVGQVGGIDARPVIPYGHRAVMNGDLNLGPWRAPLRGVVDQVRHRSGDPCGSTANQTWDAVDPKRDRRMVALGDVDDPPGEVVEVDEGERLFLAIAASKLHEVADEPG